MNRLASWPLSLLLHLGIFLTGLSVLFARTPDISSPIDEECVVKSTSFRWRKQLRLEKLEKRIRPARTEKRVETMWSRGCGQGHSTVAVYDQFGVHMRTNTYRFHDPEPGRPCPWCGGKTGPSGGDCPGTIPESGPDQPLSSPGYERQFPLKADGR